MEKINKKVKTYFYYIILLNSLSYIWPNKGVQSSCANIILVNHTIADITLVNHTIADIILVNHTIADIMLVNHTIADIIRV